MADDTKLRCNVPPPIPASQPRNGGGMECHHGSLGPDATQGIQWFLRGGPIMYQILACSIIALAVFFDRLAFLRHKHLIPERLCGVTRVW